MESTNKQKIQSFTDLIVWQEAHKLVLLVYQITRKFPREEIFGITAQMRRAVVSVTSNIAEGFARRGKKEKIQFYFIAKGSLIELESQLLVVRDLKYLEHNDCELIYEQLVSARRLLIAFIKKTDDL